jgi:PBP1b-binding outer membrane lipoprotein LpoB
MPRSVPILLLIATLLTLGCKTEPRGRIEVQEATQAERESGLIQPTALIEFSDEVPRALVQDLYSSPKLADVPRPIVVLMGDINNKTGVVSSDEFELVASRIRSNLINSSAQDELVFLERRARVSRLAEREGVVNPDTGTSERALLAGDATYLLSGDFYRVGRSNTNLYYMEFMLVNIQTTELVFSERYDVKQEN